MCGGGKLTLSKAVIKGKTIYELEKALLLENINDEKYYV
mgnify:CR=1 FL=1